MKKNILSLFIFLFFTGSLIAQDRPKIDIWNPPVQQGVRSLTVGDAAPDFKLNLFNDSRESAMLADYRDQLVILDFGNTGCSGCIAALPLMDSLQKAFGGRVKIFWVTPEYKSDIEKFWYRKNNSYTKNSSIAVVSQDSIARAYFKHRSWPHEVWIYKGKVIGITGPDYVDGANIRRVLSGEKISWPVKNDFYVFDGMKEPLFQPDPNQIDTGGTFMKYAAMSDYREGVNSIGFSGGSGIVRDPVKKTIRAFFLNQPIYNSYVMAWMNTIGAKLAKPGRMAIPGNNEIGWEVADRDKYMFTAGKGYEQDWLRRNALCYESLNPDTGQTDQQVYRAMIAELNSLLGLRAGWERREEKVLVLSGKGNARLAAKRKVSDEQHIVEKGRLKQLRDTPLSTLSWKLNQYEGNPYVFQESGYKGHVDLDLDIASWRDIAGIRKALKAYGLELREEARMVDRFIVREVEGSLLVNPDVKKTVK